MPPANYNTHHTIPQEWTRVRRSTRRQTLHNHSGSEFDTNWNKFEIAEKIAEEIAKMHKWDLSVSRIQQIINREI